MHRQTLDVTNDQGNASKVHSETSARPGYKGCHAEDNMTDAGRGVENGATNPRLLGGKLVWPSGEQCEALDMEVPHDPAIPPVGVSPGEGAQPVETPHSLVCCGTVHSCPRVESVQMSVSSSKAEEHVLYT